MSCISNVFGCCQPRTQTVEIKYPTETRILNVVLLILLTSVISIAAVALIIQYPAATKIFFSVGSVGAVASLIVLTVLCMRKYGYCQKAPQKVVEEITSTITSAPTTPSKSDSTNPFDQ